MRISIKIAIAIMLAVLVHDQAVASEATAVLAITQKHCIECHGADTQEGDARFDKLTGSPQEEPIWASILEQLEKGAMPPKDEPRLSREEHSAFTAWIERSFPKAAQAMAQKMQLPENGNFVPHEKLFDPKTAEQGPKIAASPATSPYGPENLLATILHTLFDAGEIRIKPDLVPTEVADTILNSKPIVELF